MDPKPIGLLCQSDANKRPFWCLRPQNLKFRMLHNGFHHSYIKMRLRPANSGIDMDPKPIGLLCQSDAKQSDTFTAWGRKISNLGCFIMAFTILISKCACCRQILELIWIQNRLVYYANLMQKSDPFGAWGLKISNLGCFIMAFTIHISKCACGRQILELIWIQNRLVYYANLMQKSDTFTAWGRKISNLGCFIMAFTIHKSKCACGRQILELIWIQNRLVYCANLMQKSDPFGAWGCKISNLGCFTIAFTILISKCACGRQILELIWIQNRLVYYANLMQNKVTLLLPEASTNLNFIFHHPGSCLPSPPLFTGWCLITIPPPYCVPPALCLQGGVCQQFRASPPLL